MLATPGQKSIDKIWFSIFDVVKADENNDAIAVESVWASTLVWRIDVDKMFISSVSVPVIRYSVEGYLVIRVFFEVENSIVVCSFVSWCSVDISFGNSVSIVLLVLVVENVVVAVLLIFGVVVGAPF